MKHIAQIIGVCITAAMLGACGANVSSTAPSSVTPSVGALDTFGRYTTRLRKNVQTETVLYSFLGQPDGGYPYYGKLTDLNGTLYGTTPYGGASNDGSVFTSTTTGSESVLHSFSGSPSDGALPYTHMINVGGVLYGTTVQGGTNNRGTVFKITTSGTETVLWNFGGGSGDGAYPEGGLTNVGGTLYGSTIGGGPNGVGTIFKLRCLRTGCTETMLHAFAGYDGSGPGSLTNVSGKLYGTTGAGGGRTYYGREYGWGTVFTITPSGAYNELYIFKGGSDGASPTGGLLNLDGTLYGSTYFGGGYGGSTERAYGTLFKVTASGTETVLYRFKGGVDGASPIGGLVNLGGTLYGTTYRGGANSLGTVFALLGHSGPEIVVHSFAGSGDGEYPSGALVNVGGTLYGLTEIGGASNAGTLFSLSF